MERLNIDLTRNLESNVLIHYKPGKSDVIKYKDLLKQILKVSLVLEGEDLPKEKETIGIICKKNPSSIALMLAIIELNYAFSFITTDDLSNELPTLGIQYLFSDETMQTTDFLILRNSLDVFGNKIRLYKTTYSSKARTFNTSDDPMNQVCYTITTSGTTGQRKIVRVTYNCITPNVVGLQKIFRLDKDVIFSSAPQTFDVFVLDVFLALHSGSALMLMDESLRYSDESLNFMFSPSQSTGVTFLQITPSLFQYYGLDNIKNKILHPLSSLRFLVLGGEQFPSTKEVAEWQDWDDVNRKRIFNIYGTTEMSCWAMIHEVTKEDLDVGEVPLGNLLDETNRAFLTDLHNLDLEELVLTTRSRICFIDDNEMKEALGQDHFFAQRTGDLVRRCDNKLFFYCRRNDVIKKFGDRVDLSKVEAIASEIIPSSVSIYMKKRIVLFVKTEDNQLVEKLRRHLQGKLRSNEMPDDIRKINFFPLSENGKVSKQKLKEIYKDLMKDDREKRIEAEESFLEAINQILNLQLGKTKSPSSDEPDGKRMKTDFDLTFKALGGSSFDALRVSIRLEDQIGFSNGLLPKLLGDRHSIREICHYLKDLQPSNGEAMVQPFRAISSCIVTKTLQRFNLEKCVDASPALLKNSIISVGSHSHQLFNIDARTLKIISKTELGDRIESEVAVWNDCGLVGCYDGNLYCFDLHSGAELWKFDAKGMIKSKALVVDDLVIFGNYNYGINLWCLQLTKTGAELKWSSLIGSRGVLAAPLPINDTSILICTLDGTCELINVIDGGKIWSKKFESPIFSSPQKIPGRDEVIIAEVSKNVHCIDFSGNILWSFPVDGHIFSSFLFHIDSENGLKIIFGCHDKNLRCLDYEPHRKSPSLDWSVELQSQIYGTPKLVTSHHQNFVVSCSTNGFINFINLADGTIEHSHKLPGEIFSTPVVFDRKIFVGCRDNFLYCVQF